MSWTLHTCPLADIYIPTVYSRTLYLFQLQFLLETFDSLGYRNYPNIQAPRSERIIYFVQVIQCELKMPPAHGAQISTLTSFTSLCGCSRLSYGLGIDLKGRVLPWFYLRTDFQNGMR